MHYLAALENIHFIIIGAVALVVIGFAAYYIARMMKGKIELELPKKGFNRGEEISGRVTLVSKKQLELNRLYVALIGYEIIERNDKDGDRSTRRNEIYRDEVNILNGQTLPAGSNQAFDFTMVAPRGGDSPGAEFAQKMAGAASAVSGALGALGLSNSRRRMEWKIEARADLPGVDIAKSQKVRVNTV